MSVHYFDHAASTPVRQEAVDVVMAHLRDDYGNPSGVHRLARAAQRSLDASRATIATAVGAKPSEVVFCGGGSEADNLAVRGVLEESGGVAVCSAIEHHAVLDPVVAAGGRVVAVGADGRIDLDALAAALDDEVRLVSVMAANNETGVIQPTAEVAALRDRLAPQAALHVDAVQALCWIDLAEHCGAADLISISAHKFGGPKGVGALIVRSGTALRPQILGGGQESGRRSGTQNTTGIAAMAAAAAAVLAERDDQVVRVRALRDRLVDGVLATTPDAFETGNRAYKTANVAHFCFDGVESEALLFLLERADIMASAASSCASGALDPSHVLAAMGYGRTQAKGSLRMSLGYTTTEADVDAAIAAVPAAVARLRDRDRPGGRANG